MIGLKWIVVKVEHEEKRAHRLPVGLAAAAVDTILDGMIISAGFSSDQQLGTLLVVALSLELFFLTLSVGAAALIYLIAEELLVESIQAEASLLSTAMLFAGFLVLLSLKLFGQGDS